MTMTDEHHVAMPKLYGAPAYARPPRPVDSVERPPDPDDLPLEAFQTDEERAIASSIGDGSEGDAGGPATVSRPSSGLRPRPFRLRSLGRIFGGEA